MHVVAGQCEKIAIHFEESLSRHAVVVIPQFQYQNIAARICVRNARYPSSILSRRDVPGASVLFVNVDFDSRWRLGHQDADLDCQKIRYRRVSWPVCHAVVCACLQVYRSLVSCGNRRGCRARVESTSPNRTPNRLVWCSTPHTCCAASQPPWLNIDKSPCLPFVRQSPLGSCHVTRPLAAKQLQAGGQLVDNDRREL